MNISAPRSVRAPLRMQQSQVSISVIGEGQERSELSQRGQVVFTDLPAGNYLVFVERTGFTQSRQAFVINRDDPNATVSLEIRLQSLRDARLDLSGERLSGDDLADIEDVRGADLSGVDFTNPDLSRVNLCNLDLSGASLIGANLENVNLSGSRLVGARLDNSSLNNALLHGVDLLSYGRNMNGWPAYGVM